MERVEVAQNLLQQVRADNDELAQLVSRLSKADKRMATLIEYYENQWRKDYEHFEDPKAGSYEVMNQDSIYEELERKAELIKKLAKSLRKAEKTLLG